MPLYNVSLLLEHLLSDLIFSCVIVLLCWYNGCCPVLWDPIPRMCIIFPLAFFIVPRWRMCRFFYSYCMLS
jgi:hypothetical protein